MSLPICIWLSQTVIFYKNILYVTLIQIEKLKHVNFTIWMKKLSLTSQKDTIRVKLHYTVKNVTLTLQIITHHYWSIHSEFRWSATISCSRQPPLRRRILYITQYYTGMKVNFLLVSHSIEGCLRKCWEINCKYGHNIRKWNIIMHETTAFSR